MKRLFVIAMALAAIFSFSTAVVAAELCNNCTKCEIGNVPCKTYSEQGVDACIPFDYEGTRTLSNGWCKAASNPCLAIMDICECGPTPNTDFAIGETIGIRMTILVDSVSGELGAYWADNFSGSGGAGSIEMKNYPSLAWACADSGDSTGTFSDISFFKSDRVTPATPIATNVCAVKAENQTSVLASSSTSDTYVVKKDDGNFWWINIPRIRVDPNVLHNGETISVRIELLSATRGICPSCDAICECVFDIAIVCCDSTISKCIFFPYVLPGDANWNTGIVVSNTGTSVLPADMVATFTLTDYTGAKFTYVKSDFTTVVWSTYLNSILADFSGMPAAGPAYLMVSTNFGVDGYEFLDDGIFGAGTLPRQPSSCP